MDVQRRYRRLILAVGAVALAHALYTWPLQRALAVFVGGAAIAFVVELGVVQRGLLKYELEPRLLGVPYLVLLAWPATVYVALRLALLVTPLGLAAALLAAVLVTLVDLGLDPRGVDDGAWRYPRVPASSGRYRDVPYWAFATWFVVTVVTAMLASLAA